MSGRYDKIKFNVAFLKEVSKSSGVGFDVLGTLGSIEPIEPKIEANNEVNEVVVTV